MTKKLLIFFISIAAIVSCTKSTERFDSEVKDLLSKMTLDEKIGQMNQLSGGIELSEHIAAGRIGSILNCVDPKQVNEVQRIAVEQSRLGIPLIVSRDVIHGFHTIFPIPLGQAATFDTELIEKGSRIAAVEATAYGVRWTFSPMLDIARDPRWGRSAEGYGEDPYLCSQMGVAAVKGYQGESLSDPTAMAACVKHFIGYGAAEGGRDYNSTSISMRNLRNVYMPSFRASIEAGAATLMTSFNDIDGVPSTGNKWLLTDVLRDEWGFKGMVVTDWNSAGEMVPHGVSADLKEAVEQSLEAGVDMDMQSYGYIAFIKELLDEGKIKMADIDRAVSNILRLKFELGLFENPYIDENAAAAASYTAENLAAAKQTAAESAVLLKNDKNTLPLKAGKTILVTGPLADAPYEQLGTWTFDGDPDHTVTPLQALKEQFNVIYEPGLAYSRDLSTTGFAKVRSAASRADAVVVFVGEEAILSGEAHSLSDLNLKGAQSELIKAAKQSGRPVVVVVIAGRVLTVGRDLENCDAMIYSFHPGTMGGPALADLISGKINPSGKLPMTMLVEAGQAPYYYNHFNTGRPNNKNEVLLADIPMKASQTSLGNTSYYLDSGYGPLFPFGYGLSYTTFEYSEITLSATALGTSESLTATFTLTNTGKYEGTEVAMLFVRDLVGSISRPVKELKGFQRITLAPGESRKCTFTLPIEELAFYGLDYKERVEPGEFNLWIAGDSVSGEPLKFQVI